MLNVSVNYVLKCHVRKILNNADIQDVPYVRSRWFGLLI